MAETSICGLGQAALNPIISVLENFPSSSSARDEKS
jgi:NADH:ubiquinone oxidoreductase subunit F (NADH-binding)